MAHYICTGDCKGVSDEPGTCGTEDCKKHGQPLTPCHCEDKKHGGLLDTDASDE